MQSYLERLERLPIDLGQEASDEHEAFLKGLKHIISVVREAYNAHAPDLPEIVEKAAEMFDEAVYWAYSHDGGFDFLPSFAHSSESPLLKDSDVITLPGTSFYPVVHAGTDAYDVMTGMGEVPNEVVAILDTLTGFLPTLLGGISQYSIFDTLHVSS